MLSLSQALGIHSDDAVDVTRRHTTSAGTIRRIRRDMKSPTNAAKGFGPRAMHDEATTKPDTTKNTSTPRNPPGRTSGAKWKTRTARTAMALSPSIWG